MLEAISDFIYNIHNITLFLIINIILYSISWLGLWAVKKLIPNTFQKEELGSLGGFLSGSIGSVYAISTGFVLIYLIGNFNKTEDVVATEAITLMRLADTANWLPTDIKSHVFIELNDYIKDVTLHEWPLMKEGKKVDRKAIVRIQNIIKLIKGYDAEKPMQLFIKQKIFEEIQELCNVRYTRIKMSYFSLNIQYWVVIFIMTFISLLFVSMIGMKLYLHDLSIVLVSITSSCMLFLLLILDKPFRGMFAVGQEDLQNALLYMDRLKGLW